MRSQHCVNCKTKLYKYVHHVVEIHSESGIKAPILQTVACARLSGELYTCASRTCFSICMVKEREGALFRGCFRNSDALFWVYKWAKSWNLRKRVWFYFLNTWEKVFTVEFLQEFFKRKKVIFGFELKGINNQVLNILKCA